ncbi:MAG: 50S ribosomal protein L10 [Candidatus Omnitrophica bacterium]|nr:50S ribosomal protein L10 [Candidatus Omnitrophota bacterium]
MPSEIKKMMLEELSQEFGENPYVFISIFDKMKVSELSDFRQKIAKVAKRSFVAKHAFIKKIFTERNLGDVDKLLKGPAMITFGDKDPQIISKEIVDYNKGNDKLAPAGVIFENKIYDVNFIKRLAKLPSREELLTQVVVRINSPISGFVMALGQLTRGLVIAINEIKKKKESQPQTA